MGGGGWYTPYPRTPTVSNPVPVRAPEPVRGPKRDEKGRFTVKDALALHQYNDLRFTCHELEELIASVEGSEDWSEKDLKRLDKAVTVMKVGFKIFKKVLKSRAKRQVKALEEA